MKKHLKKYVHKSRLFLISAALLGVVLVTSVSALAVSAQLENKDTFCASCHSQPESTFFQRSTTQVPVDMASNHHGSQVRCIDCHSGQGVQGRLAAISLGAIDLVAFLTHTDTQPAPLTHPIPDGTQDFNRHFHAFLSRWQAIDQNAATCVDCHSAHTTNGDPTLDFLEQQQTIKVCENCHSKIGD
jgi:predicted CXXCH cytochrome family protein